MSVPKNDLLPTLIGVGVLGGLIFWLTRSSSAASQPPHASTAATPAQIAVARQALQVRPIPLGFDTLTEADRVQYFSKAQSQLHSLGYLPNTASIAWGTMDDATVAAIQAFVRHDQLLYKRIHAMGTTQPQLSAALDALDQAYRTTIQA